MKIGTQVDNLYKQKLKMEEQKKVIKKEELKLEKMKRKFDEKEMEIINTLPKEKINGVVGKFCKVELVTKEYPNVVSWDKLWSYILKNKAKDLLQKRVSAVAWKERKEDGKKIPGVVTFNKKTLSLRKL